MYNAGLVCCIKSNGKILRESKDEIFLQFNSEYSILLKNLEAKRCLVKASIDGQDVLDDNAIIIEPNRELELEGFMKGSVARNKFKFIKKTQEISDFRGDKVDDGIIRIEYWYEKVYEKRHVITEHVYHHWNYGCCSYNCRWCNNWCCCHRRDYNFQPIKPESWYDIITYTYGTSIGSSAGSGTLTSSGSTTNNLNTDSFTKCNLNASYSDTNQFKDMSHQVNCFVNQVQDEGITVKGSEVNQVFVSGNIGELEENSRVIVLRLIGVKETGQVVEKPVTVKTKKQCPTCGRKSKSHLKYCSNCGTFLE